MNEQAWKEQAARVLCGADSCWDYDTLPEQRSEISATEDSFCKDYWRKLAAALYPIVQQAIAAERGEPVAVPHVVYDMKMPPYHYQKPYTGSGGSISVPSAPPTEAQIRADERERCAKVADEHRCKPDSPVHRGTDNTARMIAAAIRSLKESDNGAG